MARPNFGRGSRGGRGGRGAGRGRFNAPRGDDYELAFDGSIKLRTLHEDDDVLVISKPVGCMAHPCPGHWDAGTVAHALVGRVPPEMLRDRGDHNETDSYIPRAIVHRLDAGTTGLMLIAKTLKAQTGLTDQMKERASKKTYIALLMGHPGGEQQLQTIRVNEPIGRNPANPKRMAVTSAGKPASSVVHVHAYDAEHDIALVSVDLLTGRQHQIRVHCAHLAAPVANDDVYAPATKNDTLRRSFGKFSRQRPLLHAWAMQVAHPANGELLDVRAPVPDDMSAVVQLLWPRLPTDPVQWPNSIVQCLGKKRKTSVDESLAKPAVCAVGSSDRRAGKKCQASSDESLAKLAVSEAGGCDKRKEAPFASPARHYTGVPSSASMAAPQDGCEVFIKFLPSCADEDGVKTLFQDCGDILGDVRLMRDSKTGKCKGIGWVTFTTEKGADAAVAASGRHYGGRNVEVARSKKTSWAGGHAASVGGVTGTVQAIGTHTPAMASEVIRSVVGTDTDAAYVDGTFGRGGHTGEILAALGPQGSLHAFDLDPEAVVVAKKLAKKDSRFHIHHAGFASMADVLRELGVKPAGVFLDLGISSPQLDDSTRGFRAEQDGPLDLRFDLTKGQSAAEFLRSASREELFRILSEYGDPSDPHAARRVTDAICLARAPGGSGCPTTTRAFASLVANARGYEYQAMHAAKATFQALRIHINDEFGEFKKGMAAALKILRPGGRLGVLTWKHSECALLVEFLRSRELAPKQFPLLKWYKATPGLSEIQERWGFEADTAQRPSAEEMRINSRARSAVLHVLRKKKGLRCADLEAVAEAEMAWANADDEEKIDAEEQPRKKKKRRDD